MLPMIMANTEDQTPVNHLISQMIDKIAKKQNVFFKSLQKDEKDLTFSEKRLIVDNLFSERKDLFLQRYGNCLSEEELNYFDVFEEDSVTSLIVKNLKENLVRNARQSVVKNRRYQALQNLIQSEDYFTDIQMQRRDPLLFERMVGQYMTEEEKTKMINEKYSQNHDRITLSSFLLEQIDKNYIDDKMQEQKNAEEIEEFDSESDEEEEDLETEDLPKKECLDETQKQELKEEFKKLMTERFLEGKDREFYDYNQCDHNMELDVNQINERDIEERYFDEDEDHIT